MVDGRRERKRNELRHRIAGVAMGLFLERGFDAVTVAEVAESADVAEKTVFNHFPTKADLVFDAGDDLFAELLATIRERSAGEPVVHAVRRFRLRPARAGRPEGPSAAYLALIAGSPALQAHLRAMFARWESALAGELARQTGTAADAVEPFVVAAALTAVLRAPFEATGPDPGHRGAVTALDLLSDGIGRYAPAAPPPD